MKILPTRKQLSRFSQADGLDFVVIVIENELNFVSQMCYRKQSPFLYTETDILIYSSFKKESVDSVLCNHLVWKCNCHASLLLKSESCKLLAGDTKSLRILKTETHSNK